MKRDMKKLNIILAILFAFALPLTVWAATSEVTFTKWFTSTDTGDATGTTGASTISAHGGTVSFSGSTPVIDFYSVTADNAANRLYILADGSVSTAMTAATSATGTVMHVNGTTGFVAEDYVALQNDSTQKFEVNKIASMADASHITLARATATGNDFAIGTKIKKLSVLYSVPVGAATVTTSAGLVGKPGKVLAWHLDGSVAARIHNVSGHYEK